MADAVDDRASNAALEAKAAALKAKGFSGPTIAALLIIAFLSASMKVGPLAGLMDSATLAYDETAKTEVKAQRYYDVQTARIVRLEAEAAARAAGGP